MIPAAPKIDWTVSLGNLLSMVTIMGSILGLYISLVEDVTVVKARTEAVVRMQTQISQIQESLDNTRRDVAVIKDRMEYKREPPPR